MATIEADAVENLDQLAIVHVESSAAAVLNKSEVEAQLDAAHRYRRSIKRFLDEAISLATFSVEIAESCIYALPRDGKVLKGPSVRLAEMCASAYGNLHIGARVVGAEEKEVVAQGVAWDLEKNLRVTIEKRRRITTKEGKRFKDDMVTVTGNAAASIALRDAIFRVIPRAYINAVYERAQQTAIGDASTLVEKRTRVIEGLFKMGIPKERIFARVEKVGADDVGLAELETLIGLANAIKTGDITADDAFPVVRQERGTLSMNDLSPAQEKPAAAAQPAQPATQQEPILSEICDKDDWHDIETAATDAKVKIPRIYEHILQTMGCRPAEALPKVRKGEVIAWIKSQKR